MLLGCCSAKLLPGPFGVVPGPFGADEQVLYVQGSLQLG